MSIFVVVAASTLDHLFTIVIMATGVPQRFRITNNDAFADELLW